MNPIERLKDLKSNHTYENEISRADCDACFLLCELERMGAESAGIKEAFEDRCRVIAMQLEDKKVLEAKVERLEGAIAASSGLKCPSCDDVGYTVGSYRDHRGDECPEQIQCEFCYTVEDSIFMRQQALSEDT